MITSTPPCAAVCILACDEGVLFTDPPIHYMDLRFCVSYRNSSSMWHQYEHVETIFIYFTQSMMLESTRGQKFCEKETIQTLATLFDSWPGMDKNISSCNMVSKIFCLLLSWFIVVSDSSSCRSIFPMHPSTDTSCMSLTKRHVVYIL